MDSIETNYSSHHLPRKNIFVLLAQFVFSIVFFPVYLLLRILKPFKFFRDLVRIGPRAFIPKKIGFKFLILRPIALFITLFFILPFWVIGYAVAGYTAANEVGLVSHNISVAGTGSMYPTFPKGEEKDLKKQADEIVSTQGMFPYPNGVMLFGKRYFGHEIGRGDIVTLSNDTIDKINKEIYGTEAGWIKRVIAISGDTLELRDGIVYLNSKPLEEPYIAHARSTFGESFLKECVKITVPDHSVFVMGDNRKGSGDSREAGFFDISAITYALPYESQTGEVVKHWRDTKDDFSEQSRITVDKEKYVELLNIKRKEAGAKPLKYQEKLEESAKKRGEVILKFDDYSFEATRSGYTMQKAMRDVGYSNYLWGEAPVSGYFDADELIENQFEFPESKQFLLNAKYQDVGVAEVQQDVNGCPTHVVVQQFAGYVPPNYKKSDIDPWPAILSNLHDIQPGWSDAKNHDDYYQSHKADVDRINEIIVTRINIANSILGKMNSNQWLTDADERSIDQFNALAIEQNTIANRLNN